MPAKHTIREYLPDSYYHLYNCGVAKQPMFYEQADKLFFLSLFDRHLNPVSETTGSTGLPYPKFNEQLELLCYCLMKNHYHMMLYVRDDPRVVTDFMRSIGTAYTMYFNSKYHRVGPLFQGRFKASHISSDAYVQQISRYIHLNPRHYETYRYSSINAYKGNAYPAWLKPSRVLALFEPDEYMSFLKEYQKPKVLSEQIRKLLANN